MKTPKRVLLASHGSPGGRAAEKVALQSAAAGATLHHLVVVPDFWKGMQGDDWLNNASTRDVFARHVETTLEREVRAEMARVEKAARKRRLKYRPEMVLGDPVDCLLNTARRVRPDLVVAGAPRPKGRTGLRSRLVTEELLRELRAPLLVVPYPA